MIDTANYKPRNRYTASLVLAIIRRYLDRHPMFLPWVSLALSIFAFLLSLLVPILRHFEQ